MDDCERESVRKSHLGRQANKKKGPLQRPPQCLSHVRVGPEAGEKKRRLKRKWCEEGRNLAPDCGRRLENNQTGH